MNYIDVWGEVLSSLRKTLPSHALSAWFEPVDPIGFSGDKILFPDEYNSILIRTEKDVADIPKINADNK